MPGGYRVEKWTAFHTPNSAMLRHQLVVEGYDVFQWSDQPGMVYGLHKHDRAQSHWVISGSLELSVQDFGDFVLEAGDRDFMPAGTYHSARVVSDEPVLYLIGEMRAPIVDEKPAVKKRRSAGKAKIGKSSKK